jgi:hypothetical protein
VTGCGAIKPLQLRAPRLRQPVQQILRQQIRALRETDRGDQILFPHLLCLLLERVDTGGDLGLLRVEVLFRKNRQGFSDPIEAFVEQMIIFAQLIRCKDLP